MGLFDKLFGGGKKKKRSQETLQTRGAHMPDLKIPVDEKFTIQFKKNGGKFIYCEVFFTTCEHLVAQNGSILVSSNQLLEKKLNEIPQNIIVFATTSQMVDSIGEGLKIIKRKYRERIPTNITTLKHFNPSSEDNRDFLTYGSSSKHLYLLLLEDL